MVNKSVDSPRINSMGYLYIYTRNDMGVKAELKRLSSTFSQSLVSL